jgi:hypothetical protein
LQRAGINCSTNRFNRYDTIASPEDLAFLFELLHSVKDFEGRPVAFTALAVVANPDFKKIKENEFTRYFYEPLNQTLDSYYGEGGVFKLWQQGIETKVFMPQFHGREHLNAELWLNGLKGGDSNLLTAFNYNAIGVPMSQQKSSKSYLAAFDYDYNQSSLDFICEDGLRLFNHLFGYRASLFSAPSLIHSNKIEIVLANNGIQFVDRARLSHVPRGKGIYRRKYFTLGRRNDLGQFYLVRNCSFEPNYFTDMTSVDRALSDIEIAFRWHKPAIISSHRVNFVSGLSMSNRDQGLLCLKTLINKIRVKWPDVEFFTFNDFIQEVRSEASTS